MKTLAANQNPSCNSI